MEVVVPQGVKSVSALLDGTRGPGGLPLVLGDEEQAATAGGLAGNRRQLRENMSIGMILDRGDRVESKTVEMEFFDPVTDVGAKEVADRVRGGAVEIDRIAPVGPVTLRFVIRREFRKG